MDKEDYLMIAKYVAVYGAVILCMWIAGKFFADQVSDYEVISPQQEVECVVVSRMFNTSVDCWKK